MLKSLLAMTAALMTPGALRGAASDSSPGSARPARDKFGDLLPMRKLGRTGATVTMLGLGGSHISDFMEEAMAEKVIEAALAGGVRFFDTAASYGRGRSEEIFGRVLTPRYREAIFLMTKTTARTAENARRDLEGSLRRLKTDYLDLWQIHAIGSAEDVNRRVDDGVLDVFLEAQAEGKVKHIGFTGHTRPEAHQRMLEIAGEKGDPLTTCQMPINIADPSYSSFILGVLPALVERGYGVLAMKTLGNGGFFGGTRHGQGGPNPKVVERVSIADCIHFAYSLPISVLITGPNNVEMLEEKIELTRSFTGMTEERRQELIARVADMAGRTVEFYKA